MRKKTLQETKNVIKYNIKQHKPSCGENKTFSPRHTIMVPTHLDNESTEISLERKHTVPRISRTQIHNR